MSRVRTIGAMASAVALVGAGAAAALVATNVPPASSDPVSHAQVLTAPAGRLDLVCPPIPQIPEGATGFDASFNPIPIVSDTSRTGLTMPRDDVLPTEASFVMDGTAVGASGAAALVAGGNGSDGVFEAAPLDTTAPLAAASGLWRANAGDFRALVGLDCTPSSLDAWLVGGSAAVGASSQLTLTNPGTTPVTVTAELWGPTGPIEAPNLTGIVVAPGASQRLLLEASAAGVPRLVVHVHAEGGSIGASILATQLDGYTPMGTDTVTAGAAPSTSVLIPGVTLADGSDSLVRVANVNDTAATVSISLLTSGGALDIPGAESFTVDAGSVFDVSLAGLPAGDNAVLVTSDVPMVAGAEVARASSGGRDIAWAPSVEPASSMVISVPNLSSDGRLVLANSSDEVIDITAQPYDSAGNPLDVVAVSIPAHGTASIAAAQLGQGAHLVGSAPFAASLVLASPEGDGELISVLPVHQDAAQTHEIEITVLEQ